MKRTLILAAMGALMVAAGMIFIRTVAEPPEHYPSWAQRGFPTEASSFPIPPPGASGFAPREPPPPTTYTVCGIAHAENCWTVQGTPH